MPRWDFLLYRECHDGTSFCIETDTMGKSHCGILYTEGSPIVAFFIQMEVPSWHSLYRRKSHCGILYTEGSPIMAFSIQKEVPSWHSLYRRKSHRGILYTEGSHIVAFSIQKEVSSWHALHRPRWDFLLYRECHDGTSFCIENATMGLPSV
jgi:hypothetical protein